MSDRDKMLGEFRQGIAGIDPVLDRAADYGRGVKAVQQVMRSQGEVMSAALSNNHQLYHDNKKLTARCREIDGQNRGLLRTIELKDQRIEQLSQYVANLETEGGDRYRVLYEQTKRLLESYLYDRLDSEQLSEKLEQMKTQAAELAANPDKATPEEINQTPADEELTRGL